MKDFMQSTNVEYKEDHKKEKEEKEEHVENFADVQNSIEQQEKMEKEMKKKEKIPFWSENPNILFQQKYIFEFYPVNSMSYEQKLNSITRLILLLIILSYVYSSNLRILIIGAITIFAVYLMHYFHNKEKQKRESKRIVESAKEGFESPALDYLRENNLPIPDDVFEKPDSSNPFNNVLVTDYDYNPNKKPAPPAFNADVEEDILTQAKKLVSDANPDHPDIANKLFSDMGSNYNLEQSLRPFHSNPSTTIPNDQGAFAEFCYGSMISCKEGNDFACARNLARHIN